MDRTDTFYSLTPFVVMEALDKAGLRPDGSSLQLNSLENRVYDLGLEGGDHVVAKFYRPGRWSREQIGEEHEFLALLAEDEIPVCHPRAFPGGGTIREIEGIYYAVWPRTGGRQSDEFSDVQLAMLGRYLGRIHSAGRSLEYKHRPVLNKTRMVDESLEFIETLSLDRSVYDRFASRAWEGAEIYERISRNVPLITIHGDCHTGNLLYDGEGFFFLDFDDTLTGPAVQDLWMLLGGDDGDYARRQQLILEGYRTFMPFEESWLRLIEPLRALRMIYYVGWVAKRHDDPAFIHAFPGWGTADYWEQEIADLEKQLSRCPGRKKAAETTVWQLDYPTGFAADRDSADGDREKPVEEMTNGDYFFDWEE